MSWTKLDLDVQPRFQELEGILDSLRGMKRGMATVEAEGGHPQYPARNPVNIVGDYLTKIREIVVQHLRQKFGAVFLNIATEIVVTVPAEWSYEAKNATYRAFSQAGFTKRYFRELQGIFIISEPEAAALYAARTLRPGTSEMQPLAEN
jgi:molecular chaperone DnaK (HSP70)